MPTTTTPSPTPTAVIAFVTAGCSFRKSPIPCAASANAPDMPETAGSTADVNAVEMEFPASCHLSPRDWASSAIELNALLVSTEPPSIPANTGRMPAPKSSYIVPKRLTAAVFFSIGSVILSSALTTSKNAVRAVSPPAANLAAIVSAFIPNISKASVVVSLPSFTRILNSLTASPTLSTENTPASAPSTRLDINSSAERPRAAYCAEYSFSTSNRSPF